MIRIVADTTCSVPLPQLQKAGIDTLPQIIIFEQESYRDDGELDTETFLKKLKASNDLPKTAAPSPALYTPIYKRYSEQGDTIIVITPSAEVSGTYRSAQVASQDFPKADIRIIDSRTVAGGLGTLVLQAAAWAGDGMDPDTLVSKVREMASREMVYFLVDTLEYLQKGGRIGGAKALMGSLLQVKPILTLADGKIAPVESQRTKRRGQARLIELTLQNYPKGKEGFLKVSHCGAEEDARCLAEELASALGLVDIPIYLVPPAIVVHGGPGILSTSFFSNE